jgi:hypothetical protein
MYRKPHPALIAALAGRLDVVALSDEAGDDAFDPTVTLAGTGDLL